ncbi:MAG TPA: hypothetical protein VFA83_00340 [Acidimicrobiales bacterium]|nr:hypothetical protein [Acidimicrobiales bacterium]
MPDRPADELGDRLAGADAPRPMSPGMRERLEQLLVAPGAPFPGDVRVAVERALLPELAAGDVDSPRAMPVEFRARLESVLAGPARRPLGRRTPAWLAGVAAALLLLAGVAGVATHESRRPTGPVAIRPGQAVTDASGADAGTSNAANAEPATVPTVLLPASGTSASGGAVPPRPGAASPLGGSSGATGMGPPPPFAYLASVSMADAPAGSTGAGSGPPPPPKSGPPLRIGVVTGGPSERAFRGYVDLLNGNGGISGRPVQLVAVTPSHPASGLVAAVNLGSGPAAGQSGPPPWTGTPLLELPQAMSDVLHDPVFDMASPLDRVAHILADTAYPNPSPGATAVIFTGSQPPWSDRVPQALTDRLQAQSVAVVRLAYTPGRTAFPPADAAFLSLDTAEASSWLSDAAAMGYHPSKLAGLSALDEAAVRSRLPDGTIVASAYVRPPTGAEEAALEKAAGGSPGAADLHGWATAKSLAVALWRSGATTTTGARQALLGLGGYDSGLAPAYETRAGTTSRTPEAVVLRAAGGTLNPDGGFRRDPT